MVAIAHTGLAQRPAAAGNAQVADLRINYIYCPLAKD